MRRDRTGGDRRDRGDLPRSPDLEQASGPTSKPESRRPRGSARPLAPRPARRLRPGVGRPDHVYSTRGCFVEGFGLDPEGLDLDPTCSTGSTRCSTWRSTPAGGLAGREDEAGRRSRVGVVFGNIVLPTETASEIARATLGRTFEESLGIESGSRLEPFEPLNTRVAGLPAGLLAKALGLGGGAYTIDAACASSLYALKLASDELLEGRADAMLTGGLSRPDPLYTQMGFSQLRALSPTGTASPFGRPMAWSWAKGRGCSSSSGWATRSARGTRSTA